MGDIVNFILDLVGDMGYIGIFIMMFLESTFFPFPSEVAMIPAGYLASKGEMSIYFAILTGTLGSLAGAIFNYTLAKRYGRDAVLKFGRYFSFDEVKLKKMEEFFNRHGSFSTFTSRLIPAVRQFISLPAGLAKMPLTPFIIYTTAGALLWVTVLAMLGFVIGDNQEAIESYLREITIATMVLIGVGTFIYIKIKDRKTN
ncbi:MAG: DedA family protein [Epsilonproteobacteria bacterium]|nr:DedA family protein [Campylobacterota bacterium]